MNHIRTDLGIPNDSVSLISALALTKHPKFEEILLLLGVSRESANTLIPLAYFPDGGVDFVRVLVSNDKIVTLDLPWIDGEPLEVDEVVSLDSYTLGLKRVDQIRLAVARQIAEKR